MEIDQLQKYADFMNENGIVKLSVNGIEMLIDPSIAQRIKAGKDQEESKPEEKLSPTERAKKIKEEKERLLFQSA